MVLLIVLLLLAALLGNLILYGIAFLLARTLVKSLIARFAPAARRRWPANWISLALVLAFAFGFPLGSNLIRHHERAGLAGDDIPWDGNLAGIRTVALLTDRREDKDWHKPMECGPVRCRLPLYHGVVDAVLTGSPPPIGAPLEPAMVVTRYRLDRRTWCPPFEDLYSSNGRDLDVLAGAAAGRCLTAEPATLASADAIVLDQRLNPANRPNYRTVHEPLVGERLSVYVRDGKGRRVRYQKTAVGGSDWFVPVLVGPLNRNLFGALMFGGGMLGFMTSGDIEPPPLSLDDALSHWGLGRHDGTIRSGDETAILARTVLADTTVPRASAAMQFLASYAWHDDWPIGDIATVAAIIRDRRVTDFPALPPRKATPVDLARPILDRVLGTDPAPADDWARRHNRSAIEILARAFSLLPPCAAAPLYADLRRVAFDDTRNRYAAAMLSRLGDAGPAAIDDVTLLIRTVSAGGRTQNNAGEWRDVYGEPMGNGRILISTFRALARIGPEARPAAPVVVAIVEDKRAKSLPALRAAGYVALFGMGAVQALKEVYPRALDQQAIKLLKRDLPQGSGNSCGG